MKLVSFFLYVNTFIYTSGEKVHQGQFPFAQKYPFTNAGIASERSIYFPEFQTLSPYFTSNNYDDAYKLLPSVQALSNSFPTSIPILITPPTDERSQRRIDANENINKSAPTPFTYNQTKINPNNKDAERRNFPIESPVNYKQPIDRMDTKVSAQISSSSELVKPLSTNAVSKKFIISAESSNNQDLDQKASFHNVHFAPPPSLYIQSTTETAIPILRLSNEMDLDGSFSYEALGADQTHYVQHSRMENFGTDKESQVVEGSYSYVGDNGQTYTVHYIADSNGYRATGDHLPVPPPVPEIIQRSIQYNLAEEAKKPPHLRYYEDENDAVFNSDKNNQNYVSTQNNLFTGRTPEAFSYALPQRRTIQNDLAPLTISKKLGNQNVEFSEDKFKGNTNHETLEPQITFLASQGANSPLNKPQKSALPQLVNYEQSQNKPSSKESENLKALWRWQYGSNSNNLNPEKNLISRSSSEGDDVIINFNEMSPSEYSKAIRNYENSLTNSNYELFHEQQNNSHKYTNNNKDINVNASSENQNYYDTNNHNTKTEATVNAAAFNQLNIKYEDVDKDLSKTQTEMSKSKEIYEIHNPYDFTVSTEMPEWFRYESVSYKPKIMASSTADNTNKFSRNEYITNKSNNSEHKHDINIKEEGISFNTVNPADFQNTIQYQENEELQFQELPVLVKRQEIKTHNNHEQGISTTEGINEMIRDNIFLRNLFNTKSSDTRQNYLQNEHRIDSKLNSLTDTSAKSVDSESKFVAVTSPKSAKNEPILPNEIKFEKKPLDMSDVLNYVINKNIFESNKLKGKSKPLVLNNDINQNQQYGFHTDKRKSMNIENNVDTVHIQNNFKSQPQSQEKRVVYKNYKVIQRNNIRKLNTEEENHSQNTHEIKNQNIYSVKLPHLGRAGPTTRSYLPPIYL